MKNKTNLKLLKNSIRFGLTKPSNILLLIFAILLALLTIYPMFALLISSVQMGKMDSLMYNQLFGSSLKDGSFSFNNYSMLLFGKYSSEYSISFFWRPFWNSLRLSVYTSIIAVLLGGVVAWFITRTNIKFKKIISAIFVFPYIMPSWTLALVWKNVFTNSQVGSGVVGMLESVTGICVPEWCVYGIFPCSVVMGLHFAPFAYILIGGILRNMEANLEEAATVLKASRAKILGRITLPIVMPALFSTVLLVFSSSMASYAVPLFIGSPGNFFVMSTMLKSLYDSSYSGQAYIMTLVLVGLGVGLLGLNQWFTGKRKSFTTVTGKSGQVSFINLGKANYVISILMLVVLLIIAIFPIFSFALESMCKTPGNYSALTLDYWFSRNEITDYNVRIECGIFFNPTIWKALWGSIKLSIVVALIVGTCGILIGYAVSRNKGKRTANFVSNLAFFPYLVPSMAFGAIFLAVASKLTFLRGTFLLLAIVGAVKYLPFASRSGTNAMMQLSGEIEEAAIMMNVPWWKRMLRVLFPIQKSSFISGYLLPFVSCMRELSLFVLLTTSGTLITTLLSYFDERGVTQISNGMNLLIIVVVLLVNFITNKVTGASIDKGVGG